MTLKQMHVQQWIAGAPAETIITPFHFLQRADALPQEERGLIVEDDRFTLDLMSDVFAMMNFQVAKAGSAHDASGNIFFPSDHHRFHHKIDCRGSICSQQRNSIWLEFI